MLLNLYELQANRKLHSAIAYLILKFVLPQKAPFSSLSHKQDGSKVLIAVALSNKAVGVDLEIKKALEESLLNFFNDEEYKVLGSKSWRSFYILWTAKEAIIKKLHIAKDIRQEIKPIKYKHNCGIFSYRKQLHFVKFFENQKIIVAVCVK